MGVGISRGMVLRILAHAANEPGREVCGLLLGATDGRIDEAMRTANVAADPACAFEIDPAALFAAIRVERGGGHRILGHYHSHPSGSAIPSARDAAMADKPGRLWLIVAGGAIEAWRERRGGPVQGAFDPVPLVVED